jgi:HEAT repeat protein
LQINEWLNKHAKQTVNENIQGRMVIGIPLRFVLLISLFSYHPRVLNAWVKKNIGKAIEEFKKIATVDKRKIHISSVPVNLKDKAKVRLKYLENRLRLIRTKEPGYKVLFDLDPLAEYLASLYLVDCYGEDEKKWREFLAEADSKPGAPEAIKGFLLAVRDCYLAKVPEAKVTDFVPEELGRRADLDPEKVEQAQLKQRIERLKSQFTVPEAEDRIHAAKELRKIGSAAKDAVPTLVNALKDEEISVRVHSAEALAVICSTAPDIFPVLMEGMKDTNIEVRQSAVYGLGKIVSEVKEAFPALIKALKDPIKEVRWTALVALRQIGPEPQAAVPDLIKALKNEDKDFRLGAAIGLGGIGSEAKAAVPDLMEALKDESKYVRRFAFLALKEIAWKAK